MDTTRDYILNNDIQDKDKVLSYYDKYMAISQMNDTVINKKQCLVHSGYGNLNSRLILVFKDKTMEKYLTIYKKMFETLKASNFDIQLHDIYITYFFKYELKCKEDVDDCVKILKYEMSLFNNSLFITHGFDTKLPSTIFIDDNKYGRLVELFDKKGLTTEEEKELNLLKTDFNKLIAPIGSYLIN